MKYENKKETQGVRRRLQKWMRGYLDNILRRYRFTSSIIEDFS